MPTRLDAVQHGTCARCCAPPHPVTPLKRLLLPAARWQNSATGHAHPPPPRRAPLQAHTTHLPTPIACPHADPPLPPAWAAPRQARSASAGPSPCAHTSASHMHKTIHYCPDPAWHKPRLDLPWAPGARWHLTPRTEAVQLETKAERRGSKPRPAARKAHPKPPRLMPTHTHPTPSARACARAINQHSRSFIQRKQVIRFQPLKPGGGPAAPPG